MRKTILSLVLCVSLLSLAQQTSTTTQRQSARRATQQQTQAQSEAAPGSTAAPGEAAQPQTSYTSEQPPAPVPTPTSRTHPMYPEVNPDMLRAPQPGHPLDPRDVDILTGKTGRQYAAPPAAYYYGYPGYSYGYPYPAGPMPSFTSSGLLSSPNLDATPRYAPMYFGVFNGRPFFIAGDTTLTNPSSLVFGPVFTPFTPVTPVFSFGSFSRAPQFGSQQPFPAAAPTRVTPRTSAPTRTTTPSRPR